MIQLDDARVRGDFGADKFRPRDSYTSFLNLPGETQCGQTATNEVADRGRFRQDLPPEIDRDPPRADCAKSSIYKGIAGSAMSFS